MQNLTSKTFFLGLLLSFATPLILSSCSNSDESGQSSDKASNGRQLNYTHTLLFLNSARSDTLGSIDIDVAETKQERNDGLMNVNSLPDDKGMLFVFDRQEPRSFWMANTPLSLDIIFADNQGKIVRVHHQTKPFSDQQYVSRKPARYVVEVVGGYSISHDIKEGDFVVLPDEFSAAE